MKSVVRYFGFSAGTVAAMMLAVGVTALTPKKSEAVPPLVLYGGVALLCLIGTGCNEPVTCNNGSSSCITVTRPDGTGECGNPNVRCTPEGLNRNCNCYFTNRNCTCQGNG